MKTIFVVKGEAEMFVVREEEDAYRVGDTYDGSKNVISTIELHCDGRVDGLMRFDEVETLLLDIIETAYKKGRLDEQARVERRLREAHDFAEAFLLEW